MVLLLLEVHYKPHSGDGYAIPSAVRCIGTVATKQPTQVLRGPHGHQDETVINMVWDTNEVLKIDPACPSEGLNDIWYEMAHILEIPRFVVKKKVRRSPPPQRVPQRARDANKKQVKEEYAGSYHADDQPRPRRRREKYTTTAGDGVGMSEGLSAEEEARYGSNTFGI